MSKLWDWYDDLSKDHGTLRFLLFMAAMVVFMVLIPAIVASLFGLKYFSPTSDLGLVVMWLLALSKHFRWPK
jgi:hypothetical protein